MTLIWFSAILLALVTNAVSDYNEEVCSIFEKSYGLIPPPLPRSFEMKFEHVDHTKKYATYEEIYFDYTNSRAKYKYLLNTLEFNYLFDYDTQQVVEWIKAHPGVSMERDPISHNCEAINMESSKYRYIFGYQDWIYLRPKMFNSYEVLRYGGQYLYAANGSEKLDERGLHVNKFVGCLYDESIDATMSNEYYFADTNIVQPSGGTPSAIVIGSDDKPLSVPVKLHITGGHFEDDKKWNSFNKTISISWFKGNPEFQDETFQIPPWMYCKNFRGRKEIPLLPRAFSTRLAVTMFEVDIFGELQPTLNEEAYQEIYYDLDRNLARRDFTPNPFIDTDIFSKFGNFNPVSTVYDFNQGIRYTIDKVSGSCYIKPIVDNDFFDVEEQLLYRKLALPEEIFLMQKDDMEYKGKAFARDVECDVWNGKHYHELYETTLRKETYFSTDGWHMNADGEVERRIPVKHVLIKEKEDGSESISTYNFLKFKNIPPKMFSFDIRKCVELIDHKRFAIELALTGELSDRIFKYRFNFLEAAQIYIANKTQLNTPLRVQRLHLRYQSADNSGRVFLVFSLLAKANLEEKDNPIIMIQTGKDLPEAIVLLQKLVDDGKFVVGFNDPKTKEEISVQAEKGGLYSLTAGGNLTPAPLRPANLLEAEKDESVTTDAPSSEEKSGMTGGHLALLSFAMLFIGVAIGIAIMYLYLRIYSERLVDDRIHMSEAVSTSAAGGSRNT